MKCEMVAVLHSLFFQNSSVETPLDIQLKPGLQCFTSYYHNETSSQQRCGGLRIPSTLPFWCGAAKPRRTRTVVPEDEAVPILPTQGVSRWSTM